MIKIEFFDENLRENRSIEVKQEKFGDNTLKCYLGSIKEPESILFQLCCYDIRKMTIVWCYDSDSELFTLISLVESLRDFMGNDIKISLSLPYIPHARQDRYVSGRVFTLKYFAKIINSLNFTKVRVIDPHSDVASALIDRIEIDPGFNFISLNDERVWMFPDAGAAKKYSAYDNAPKNFIIGNKKRNNEGRIESYDLINFKEGTKEVWIRDDICSYGGTFVSAAKALRERGVEKIYLILSHCENNILKGEVFEYIDAVYTTDSILTEKHEKIRIYKSFRG